ncbi:hypothetical protein [Halobacterium jilantaiense]|uniref:hypothetical protein n=1 Tax=Halobacterium jilantaiense TaxID=355548 RepID=UPI00115FB9C5|nr:hypothetical protein [Halobacterium jilantaiense]
MSWTNALYFGGGLALIQTLHTVHAATAYGQKQVRWLEWPRPFESFTERDDPHSDQLKTLFRPLKRPHRLPWTLPHYQMPPSDTTGLYRLLGLHATNLYYAYASAFVYGLGAVLATRYLLTFPGTFTRTFVVDISALFVILFGLSHWAVGSSFEVFILESNLAFNLLMLITLQAGVVGYGTAISTLQFVTALISAPLVFWLTFQYQNGNLDYGSFMPAYFVMLSVLYSEFFVLILGLLYVY